MSSSSRGWVMIVHSQLAPDSGKGQNLRVISVYSKKPDVLIKAEAPGIFILRCLKASIRLNPLRLQLGAQDHPGRV